MVYSNELLEVAKRIFWFGTPEEALEFPLRFLTYAMTYASDEDIEILGRHFSDDDFNAALDNPAPGILDQSSWPSGIDAMAVLPFLRFRSAVFQV
jgi:hypothetical protein